jgi:hypothetical protein
MYNEQRYNLYFIIKYDQVNHIKEGEINMSFRTHEIHGECIKLLIDKSERKKSTGELGLIRG